MVKRRIKKNKLKKEKKKRETTTGKGVSRQKLRGEERERETVMEVKKFAEEKKQKKREE